MRRTLFEPERDQFRALVREFLARKVIPGYPRRLAEETVPREFFAQIAGIGAAGPPLPAALRVSRIHGGTGEVMKSINAKSLGR